MDAMVNRIVAAHLIRLATLTYGMRRLDNRPVVRRAHLCLFRQFLAIVYANLEIPFGTLKNAHDASLRGKSLCLPSLIVHRLRMCARPFETCADGVRGHVGDDALRIRKITKQLRCS